MKKTRLFIFGSISVVMALVGCASPGPTSTDCAVKNEGCGFFQQTGQNSYTVFVGGGNEGKDVMLARVGYELCRKGNLGFEVANKAIGGEYGSVNAEVKCKGKIDSFVKDKAAESGEHFVSNPSDQVFKGGSVFYILNAEQHDEYLNETKRMFK